METTLCPACGANSIAVAHLCSFTALNICGNRTFPVVTAVCRMCGHVHSNPRLDAGETEWYYKGYYRETVSDKSIPSTLVGLYKQDAKWIESHMGSGVGRRILEIGCYAGTFLDMMRGCGWQVCGIEPNAETAKLAAEHLGINIMSCLFENVAAPVEDSDAYDLVVMGGVLEHMNDPLSTLLRVNRFLKPQGRVFIRVPNVECLILDSVADIFTLEHPNMYSYDVLEMLLDRAGFGDIVRTVHKGWPRHMICLATMRQRLESPTPPRRNPDTFQRVFDLVTEYARFQGEERERVNKRLSCLWDEAPKSVIIYGAGNHTEFLFRHTEILRANVLALSDSNPSKIGRMIFGFEVIPADAILERKPDAVVISSRAFQDDIYTALAPLVKSGIDVIRLYDNCSEMHG